MAPWRSHSVELATLAKYPFLHEASALIRSEKVSLEEILLEPAYARARSLGKARVLEALERGPEAERVAIAIADQLAQLLAYPVARILSSAIGDTYLVRRYALHEAIAAERRLESESDDLILHLASELGMDLRRHDGGFRLHFTDFLRFTNTMRDAPWKLINQRVDIDVVPEDMYMYIDDEAGNVVAGLGYLKQGDEIILYLDVLHELTHIRQWHAGKELWDRRYNYVDRPTEIEAYRVAVDEARSLGMTDREIADYLRVEWTSREEHERLCKHLDVRSPESRAV